MEDQIDSSSKKKKSKFFFGLSKSSKIDDNSVITEKNSSTQDQDLEQPHETVVKEKFLNELNITLSPYERCIG